MRELTITQLLQRWYSFRDREALGELIRRELPWIHAHVRRSIGPVLRGKLESMDVVQEAVEEFLRYGPRVAPKCSDSFRALLARIVQNTLCDRHDWFTARRREMHLERPLPTDSIVHLERPVRTFATPSEAAARNEWQAWVRLAIELVDPEDREVILLRHWQGLTFGELGQRFGVNEDAARMRFKRSLIRLADVVDKVKRGEAMDLVNGDESEESP